MRNGNKSKMNLNNKDFKRKKVDKMKLNKKAKKVLAFMMVTVMGMTFMAGCGGEDTQEGNGDDATKITVVSREDGSGTRGAFIELVGIETKDADGNKVDNTMDTAEITNSTSVMMTTVAGNEAAIGYISLGSLNDDIKALKVDGVYPSVETVKDGTYKIARPFNIVSKEGLSAGAQDFVDFILSDEGQKVVEENGCISNGSTGPYKGKATGGKITVAGSSSVTPVMEKLKEAYIALNPDVEIDIQQSDSTTGISSTIEGICDIGMASRELKDSESSVGLEATVIAMDGIAVIVNNKNALEDITSENIMKVYTGQITTWEEL